MTVSTLAPKSSFLKKAAKTTALGIVAATGLLLAPLNSAQAAPTCGVLATGAAPQAEAAVRAACGFQGITYAWGGGHAAQPGPSQGVHDWGVADSYGDYNKIGYDCSGMVRDAYYRAAGYDILGNKTAAGEFATSNAVARFYTKDGLLPGDLVVFGSSASNIHHIAMYLGQGYMIEAPQSGSVVKVSSLTGRSDYYGAVRLYGGGTATPPAAPTPRLSVVAAGKSYVKEGDLYAGWVEEWGGAVVKSEVAGTRIGVLTNDGVLHVKDGNLWSSWTDQVGGVKDFRLTGNRIGVLRTDGSVTVKEGDLYANWVEQISGVKEIELTNNRLGILRTDGSVAVKEGNLYAGWTELATDIKDLELAGNRIGALRTNGTLAVKDGGLLALWTEQIGGISQFDMTADRLGVVTTDGLATVKEGTLYADWVNQMGSVKEVRVSGNRIGVLRTDATVAVKEGTLWASWTEQINGVSSMEMTQY